MMSSESRDPCITSFGTKCMECPVTLEYILEFLLLTLIHTCNMYSCTRSTATGFSPYYLMYWQKPQLAVNLYECHYKFQVYTNIYVRLNGAYKTAQNVIEKENKRHKLNYDHKVRCIQLAVGELVLLKRTVLKGKHKMQDC